MFLRSARNAEFKVPQEYIDEAMDYVRRTWTRIRACFITKFPPARATDTAAA